MKLKIPASGGKYLQSITACGRIQSKHLSRTAKSPVKLHAPLKSGGRVRVQVSQASNGRDLHFHIDVHSRSYFKNNPPKATNSLAEIKELLSRFEGKPIKVAATGRFAIPRKRIYDESTIGLLLRVTAGPDGAARLIGSLFEVEQEPIVVIQWHLRDADGKEELATIVESVSQTTIDELYLENLAAPLESALRSMVLEEAPE